jgi:HemY protein
MMRSLFILILLFAATILGLSLEKDPGYVLISTKTWSVETTFWIAVLILILSFFLFHLACLAIRFLINLPANFKKWHIKHQQHQAQAKTHRGLIEFSEGYWQSAKKHLIEALPHTDIPLFNYLTAARSAQELNQTQLRDNFLREAQQTEPQAKIAVKLTQAQLQIASQQWEQALATLQHLHELTPKHPYVLKLLTQLYETVKDWSALIKLLPAIKRYSTFTSQQFEVTQRHIYFEAFQELCKQSKDLESVQKFFKALPKSLQQDQGVLLIYCKFLCAQDQWPQANIILKQALNKQLHEALITLYAQLPIEEDKLMFAKGLLKIHPHSASVHTLLGQLNFQTRLFGQAKLHFQESLSIHPDPKVYFYLGETLEALDLPNEAYKTFKKGLQEISN